MPLHRSLCVAAARADSAGVRSAPDHALFLSDGFFRGTTAGESVDRALEAFGHSSDVFVRDGDLNRVDIAAGFRGPLTAGRKLGRHGGIMPPQNPRSTRSVLAAFGAASRLTSVAGALVVGFTFTSALEEQGMHS